MTTSSLRISEPMSALILASLLAAATPLPAAAQEVHAFNVSTEDSASAIRAFGMQSGIQILASADDLKGKKLNPVSGSIPTEQALNNLLAGTGLDHRYVGDHAVALVSSTESSGSSGAGGKSDGSPTHLAQSEPPVASPKIELKHFHIRKRPLADALKDFGTQSGLAIVAPTPLMVGKKGASVRGYMSSTDALGRLLKGTGLTFASAADGTIAIQPISAGGSVQSSTGKSDQNLAAGAPLATVIVNGTKLLRYDPAQNNDRPRTQDDVQPYVIIDSKTIEQSGATDINDFFRRYVTTNVQAGGLNRENIVNSNSPSQFNANNRSQFDLSGLGSDQTLILVNGRRIPGVGIAGSNGNLAQPDITGIPLAAIDHIELLPTSASAIYGASAVGGVINIVLRTNYQGAEIKILDQNTFQPTAPARNFSFIGGTSLEGGKTHVTLSLSYNDEKPLRIKDRLDFFEGYRDRAWKNDPTLVPNSPQNVPFGTTANIAGQPTCNLVNNQFVCTDGGLFGPGSSPITHVPSGYAGGGGLAPFLPVAGSYNLNPPDNAQQTGLESPLGARTKTQALDLNVRREFTPNLEAFVQFTGSKNEAVADYNPGFISAFVYSTAPSNPFGTNVNVFAPTNSSLPGASNANDQVRALVGFKLKLPYEWIIEGEVAYADSKSKYGGGSLDIASLANDVNSGKLDIFKDLLAHPIDLSPYSGALTGTIDSYSIEPSFRTAGSVWELPGGPLTLSAGTAFREERSGNGRAEYKYPNSDSISISAQRHQNSLSGYAELDAPIISGRNAVPFVRQLDFQLAGRIDRFTADTRHFTNARTTSAANPNDTTTIEQADGGSTTTYTSANSTFGVRYRPVASLMLRASFAKGFLPPTFNELQQPVSPVPPALRPIFGEWPPDFITDPKRGGEFTQIGNISGGNPALQPENSLSYNFGVVFEPTAVRGLRVSLDYARIVKHNEIAVVDSQTIVNSETAFPGRVVRGPVPPGDPYGVGPIQTVNTTWVNLFHTENISYNLAANYEFSSTIGDWSMYVNGNTIQHQRQQFTFDSPVFEYIGSGLNRSSLAKFQGAGGMLWRRGPWSASWSTRFYSHYRIYDFYKVAEGSEFVAAQLYHDVQGTYEFGRTGNYADSGWKSALDHLALQIGAHNVFNTKPAFDASNSRGYYSQYGDPRMGVYYLSLKKAF